LTGAIVRRRPSKTRWPQARKGGGTMSAAPRGS
jgi:hypothetical protein